MRPLAARGLPENEQIEVVNAPHGLGDPERVHEVPRFCGMGLRADPASVAAVDLTTETRGVG